LGDLFETNNWVYGKNKQYCTILKEPNDKSIAVVSGITENNGINYYTEDKLSKEEIFESELTISTRGEYSGTVFFQKEKFVLANNILVMKMPNLTKNQKQFIGSIINSLAYGGYSGYPKKNTLNKDKIQLPTKNKKIDYDFMENFIAEIEEERIAKLEAYLLASGLKEYTLTEEEEQVLDDFENGKLAWNEFNLEKLFGKSTRGKRLKSDDRSSGTLPFVTAGENNEGISAFVGNSITIFPKNTTTIDMFGSAKYRNYDYGGDDHIAVVHTQDLPKFASIFVTSAIHKSSYTGKFNYGRNFYAKDADELNISLPSKNKTPNYKLMETLISATQKLVIKDVILYLNKNSY